MILKGKYLNLKNNHSYIVEDIVINATNSHDGMYMVLYREEKSKKLFVREVDEFLIKFKKI